MLKTKKWYNGKVELVLISSCVFLILFAILTVIICSIKTNTLYLLILSLIVSMYFSVYTYKLFVLKILRIIIHEYFEIPKRMLSKDFNYKKKLDKIDEYVENYKKIFSKSDLIKINFTRELVTAQIQRNKEKHIND